jgi:hypothetical protein
VRNETIDIMKRCVAALEFREDVGRMCNSIRTVYESDLATVDKAFKAYITLCESAIAAGADPLTIRSCSGGQLLQTIFKARDLEG